MTDPRLPAAFEDEQAWRQVQADADHDPILAAVLDAAEMERRAEHADRVLTAAEQSGPVTQATVRRRPAWLRRAVVVVLVLLFLTLPVLYGR